MISPFARLGLLCVRAPRRTLLATALLTALMVPGIAQISVVGDLHRLIPQRSEASTGLALALEGLTRSDAVYGLLEGPADSALLLEVGATLAAELEAGELVRSARYRPAEGIPDVDPLLVFDVADPAAEQALRERLDPARAPQRAEFLRQVLSGPTGSDARAWVLRDPFGLIELLGQRVARGVQRMDTKEQAFLAPTGRALLLVIEPAYSGMGRDFHEPLHAELTSTVARVLAGHPRGGELTVGFTGSFMHAREIAKATSADSTVLTTTSILSVLAIYLLFYP